MHAIKYGRHKKCLSNANGFSDVKKKKKETKIYSIIFKIFFPNIFFHRLTYNLQQQSLQEAVISERELGVLTEEVRTGVSDNLSIVTYISKRSLQDFGVDAHRPFPY